jgi:hypothetical protein
VAGQSLGQQIRDYLEDKAYPLLSLTVFMSAIALMEWWRWYREVPPSPILATIVAALCWMWFLFRLPTFRRRLQAMRQGQEGERAVAEYLDRFRERGYYVFNDLEGDGFNVDHLLIGPTGVFTIETKTISKPARGTPRVEFDGEAILVAGQKPNRDPIVQAKAQARWIGDLLGKPGGKKVPVRPVVFYPGWYIDKLPRGAPVWVLEPKALEGFLNHAPEKFNPEELRTLAWQVKQACGKATTETRAG